MRTQVILDFETISKVDLKVVGSARYAEDPSTEVLCLVYKVDGKKYPWIPGAGKNELFELAGDPEALFIAHNAGFEKDTWRSIMVKRYGFPDIPNERWHCTLSVCAQKGLPQDLDEVTSLLGVGSKDTEGSKYVRLLNTQYRKTGTMPEVDLPRVIAYCGQDDDIEEALHHEIGWLQPGEREVWLLDQAINERGIRLDMDYVHACRCIVADATAPMEREFRGITGYNLGQNARVMDWLHDEMGDHAPPNLQKETVARLLGSDIDEDEDAPLNDWEGPGEVVDGPDGIRDSFLLPEHVRRALTIRQLVGSASVKKLARMEACVCSDGRARRLLQYHGAGPGRWAGRIIQPQNFPRPTLKEIVEDKERIISVDRMVDALMTGDHEWVDMVIGPPVHAVVQGLRHALIADRGKVFVSGDYSQIEARIVLCLAGQWDKVKIFETGTPYQDMAQSIYRRPIDKHVDVPEYTIGKNTVLGCGFQMGAKKFFARYCPQQSLEFAKEVIDNYRQDWAPMVPKVWAGLEDAAFTAVYTGRPAESYGVEYRMEGHWLTARLHSGRKLYYYGPQKCNKEMPWSTPERPDIRPGWFYWARKQGRMKKVFAFGGHLTENVVQGLARDVLRDAMPKLEANGFPLVLTVHDEGLGEPLSANADELAFAEIMCDSADWIKALRIPIKCETWAGERYKK